MAFNASVPQANQRIKDTQQPILDNFTALGSVFNGVDTLACLFPQITDPATGATQVALYQKNNELYFRRANNGTVINCTERVAANNGWTRLPSGIVMLWLNNTVNTNATGDFTLNAGFTNPNLSFVYSIVASIRTVTTPGTIVYGTGYNTGTNVLSGRILQITDGAAYANNTATINVFIVGA